MSGHNNPYEDMMSSDDSDNDHYNYLTALDNLNWKTSDHHNRSNTTHKRPAVAVKTKCNRSDGLFKDIQMAANKDKPKTDTKRDCDQMSDQNEDLLVIRDDTTHGQDIQIDVKNTKSITTTTTTAMAKNKRLKGNEMKKESDYCVKEVLQRKKDNHQKSVNNIHKSAVNRVKSDRMFGKAFSPTVYSPEVPVMRPSVSQNIPPLGPLHRRSMTLNEEISDTKYNPNHILAVILDWNTKWLSECVANEVPPPLSPFGEGIGVKTSYDSLDEYQSAYIPLILFETWAQIFDEYNKNRYSTQSFKAVLSPDYSCDDYFITLSFQTVVNKNKFRSFGFPSEGQMVLIDMTIDSMPNNESRKVRLFAYVSDFSTENINANTIVLPGLVVGPLTSGQLLVKYTALIAKKTLRINTSVEIGVQSVYYLKPTMRQIELISGLNACPLFKDILKPRSFTCQVVVPTNIKLESANFNESQNKAILGSSEAVRRPYAVPKLLLIQGPPGTGKTHTLIGIIKHIYMSWTDERMPRILICAPSNGAVDEIARRLYRERGFLHKHKVDRSLRCVRVGKVAQVHESVCVIALDKLVDTNAETEAKNIRLQNEKQSKDIENKISALEQENANLRAAKGDNKAALHKNDREMSKFAQQLHDIGAKPKPVETNKNRIRIDIMLKADIILTTLNSSHQSAIENLYRRCGPNTFDCVIVDEASQCSEPELLMPLAYRMTKMILIGDPMQLPATVISKKANSLQLGRSLFERFYHYFGECERKDMLQKSPILMLTEQYRMHPHICQFPSQQFYEGRLTSSDKLTKSRDFKIKPYIVFDVTDTQENTTDPTNKYNDLEANFVVKLVTIIERMLCDTPDSGVKYSIGVITPYNGQKNVLNKKLESKSLKVNIEVNTVDGFQGQERDIIILSCVRAFENNANHSNSIGFLNSVQRMNVALTRAKYSMILCISGRSLENDKNWKSLIDNALKRPNCRFKVPSTLKDHNLEKILQKVDKIETIVCD